jgi:hypothetical protein
MSSVSADILSNAFDDNQPRLIDNLKGETELKYRVKNKIK